MTETIQTAMDRLMTISVELQDYVAEDGLLYCGSCKTPKEAFFPNGKKLFGRDRHPAECRCRQATREREHSKIQPDTVQPCTCACLVRMAIRQRATVLQTSVPCWKPIL